MKITVVSSLRSVICCYDAGGQNVMCRSIVTTTFGRFGCAVEGPNHAFHRTLHLRQRNPATSINFIDDTLPRARRGITCAVKAPGSDLVFNLCKSDGYMYLCAFILDLRRAQDEPTESERSIPSEHRECRPYLAAMKKEKKEKVMFLIYRLYNYI